MKTVLPEISLIKRALPELQDRYPIKSLGIFGSVARGDASENSDVDVLVEFYEPVGMEFIDLVFDLEELLGRKVDLVSKKGLKPRMLPFVEKT